VILLCSVKGKAMSPSIQMKFMSLTHHTESIVSSLTRRCGHWVKLRNYKQWSIH